jgi:competence protein ComEA
MLEDLYKNNKPLFIALIIIMLVLGAGVAIFSKVLAPSDEVLALSPNRGEVLKNPTTIDDEITENMPAVSQAPLEGFIYVHITGAVKRPGVYKMPSFSRVVQVVELAGNFLPLAQTDEINLAEILKDGQKIMVPFVKIQTTGSSNSISSSKNIVNPVRKSFSNGVNINTADEAGLDCLPGIGPSTAKKIIEYRNTNGSFKAIEELKNVPGIREGKFGRIKEFVRVD